MTDLDFVECDEFEVVEAGGGSRYRATVLRFLASDLERARIVCGFVGEAQNVWRQLTRWVAEDENVRVFSRGRMVYLVREP